MKAKHNKKESGQGLMEFALVLPILIILLSGIYDVGRVVFIKTNLQHLSAEIHKMTSLYSEKGTVGGIKGGSMFYNLDEAIDYLVNTNQLVSEDNLNYEIIYHDKMERHFQRKHFDRNYQRFLPSENRNDAQFVTVRVEYRANDIFLMTNIFRKEDLVFNHEYTGLIYLGSDGYDPK